MFEFQDFDAINRPVVAMSVDNVDNIESIDNYICNLSNNQLLQKMTILRNLSVRLNL